MSFFMISMPLSGLMSSPPVSKHTPLPTSVTLGARRIAPGEVDQARRARGGAADRVDQRKVLLRADRRRRSRATLAPWRAASARAASSSSAGPMSLAGVLMRSRASVTPSAMRDEVGAVDAVGQLEPHRLVVRLAVAREAVGAEREGERGEPRVVRRVGEAVGAGRQQAGQAARQEAVLVAACRRLRARTGRRASAPSAPGQQQVPAGLRLEAGGLGEAPRARRRAARAPARKLSAVTNQIGTAARRRAQTKAGCMEKSP